MRFQAIEQPELLGDDSELRIDVTFDKDAKTLSIADNGIGMSRDEVISHLGTIAKSGTAEFLANLTGDQKSDSQLIGQFGAGFYSAFMVASEVEVRTHSAAGGDGVWRSSGEDAYTIEAADDLPRGTQVFCICRMTL